MTVIFRQNASILLGIGGAVMGGEGDGRAPDTPPVRTVQRKIRYARDPAAELMPAAEFLGHDPDFAAILEDYRDSPFAASRRRVLGRLMGMFAMDYQGSRREERNFLRRLLAARNAKEGYAANRALHLTGIGHAIRRTLALGVAESRYDKGPLAGFLGAVQARMAAGTFLLLGPESREILWNVLIAAGSNEEGPIPGAEPVIERALILKAIAARRSELGPWSKRGFEALDQIRSFADAIRGADRQALARGSNLMSPPGGCVPCLEGLDAVQCALLQARAEIDPIFALSQHGDSLEKASGQVASELDALAVLPDLDRSPILERPRMHQALAEARMAPAGKMGPAEREALTDYIAGRKLSEKRRVDKDAALDCLKDAGFDVVRPQSLEAMRQDAQGIYRFDAAQGLGALLSRYTGAVYIRRVMSDQMTARADPVGQISHALNCGLAVPFTINEGRISIPRAWTAVMQREDLGQTIIDFRRHATGDSAEVLVQQLVRRTLPKAFGKDARIDAYLAPAALDIFMPPFGIGFPALGIEDHL